MKMESLSIDGKEVIYYDFLSRDGFTLLEGSDTLNASIKNESPISRVKYVNNNSILTDTEENHVFKKFINFVDHMLLFYSLDSRGYEGFMNGSESIAEGIVNSGKVKDFENFMRENGIEYNIGISGWNKHHLFLSMSLTHFIIFEFSESVQKRLGKISGVQIFTTTHNTDLMSNDLLRPDCYFLLKDNKIKAISDLTEKELRQAHNLQQMYKAGAFNW